MDNTESSTLAEMVRSTSGRVIIKESNAGTKDVISFFRIAFLDKPVDNDQVLIFEVENRIIGDRLVDNMNMIGDPNVLVVEDINSNSGNPWRTEIAVFEKPNTGLFCEIRSLIVPQQPDGMRITFYKLGEAKLSQYHTMIQSSR